MATYKDFDVMIAEESELAGEAPVFKLRGVEFRGVARPTTAAMLKLAVSEGGLVSSIDYIASMVQFSQRQQFLDIVYDETAEGISVDVLNKVSEFLIEAYAGRPTEA